MRCDCCGTAVHKDNNNRENEHMFCYDCWADLSGDLNTLVAEVSEIRAKLAQEPKGFIATHRKTFIKQFMPSYVSGIKDIEYSNEDVIIIANCRLHHIPKRGKTVQITIDKDKYRTWKENISLYKFVHND